MHGIPGTFHSDNGRQFNLIEFSAFAAMYEFKHITSSPECPLNNSIVENAVKTFKNLMKAATTNSDFQLALLDWRNTLNIPRAPMMAATSFRALILVVYFSSIRLGTHSYPSLSHFTTCNSYSCDSWTCVGLYNCDFEELFISSRPPFAFARLLCTGFCHARVPVPKWTKHGYVSLVVPGLDPPLDITMCKDVLNVFIQGNHRVNRVEETWICI